MYLGISTIKVKVSHKFERARKAHEQDWKEEREGRNLYNYNF